MSRKEKTRLNFGQVSKETKIYKKRKRGRVGPQAVPSPVNT